MNIKKISLGILAISLFASCDFDDLPDINKKRPQRPVDLNNPSSLNPKAAQLETFYLLSSIKKDGGVPFNQKKPAVNYTASQRVFIPSSLGIDFRLTGNPGTSVGPTVKLPMFKGFETTPDGPRDGYYVITEASNKYVARALGVVFAPRMAEAKGTDGVQLGTFTKDGRLTFEGYVDFSPKRSLVARTPGEEGTPEFGLLTFPPAEVTPGAMASEDWSSYVVLPSGVVINAQMVGNSTGLHDRIATTDTSLEAQDDMSNPNFSPETASVILQLLDGWQGGDQYYFHIVTDTSAPGPAAIEKGVFAPKLANIPSFGVFPGGAMLGFSPCANGNPERDADGNIQGLNVSINSENQDQDPTNTFPIDPDDVRFSPMWDAHICEWDASVPLSDRPVLKSIEQIEEEIAAGRLGNFRGNDGPVNPFIAGLQPTRAIINCPVITQPAASVIGTTVGDFTP